MPSLRSFILVSLLTASASADVVLHPLFSDRAVLQRSDSTPIWGTADPGETIAVVLGAVKAETVADREGKWQVAIDLSTAEEGPFRLEVIGANKLTVNDVLIGDVWLSSGQSNMGWPLAQTDGAAEEIAQSANQRLRWFAVKHAASPEPLKTVQGQWVAASPATAGAFTAVGYYFGKILEAQLNRPIGILNASLGGTPLEAWTSMEALSSDPELKSGSENERARLLTYDSLAEEYVAKLKLWEEAHGRSDTASREIPTDGWSPLTTPNAWYPGGGVVWLQTKLPISPAQAGKDTELLLRNIHGVESVYWDGKLISEATPLDATKGHRRPHEIPGAAVEAGEATLTIRIFNSGSHRNLHTGTILLNKLPLASESRWEQAITLNLPAFTPEATAALPVSPGVIPIPNNTASYLFDGMISPLLPYRIAGVLWYQGEGNVRRAYQYRKAFPLLIADWRKQWGQEDLPFLFCQLASHMAKPTKPEESIWAELREAQSMALSIPHTGQAILIDVGEEDDIHPRNKKVVGERLAAIALAKHYKKSVIHSGPVFEAITFRDGKGVVSFSNIEGGLIARELPESYQPSSILPRRVPLRRDRPASQLQGFAICGEDQKWVWADAEISGDQVIVSSPEVPDPRAIRYGWSNNPTVNLYNSAGFPAAPFRTDQFRGITEDERY